MRKREQYKKPKFQNKVPTLIIMVVFLFLILFFGKNISWSIAGFFAPRVAVTDEAVVAVEDTPRGEPSKRSPNAETGTMPQNAGTVVSLANRQAAQTLLPILSKVK